MPGRKKRGPENGRPLLETPPAVPQPLGELDFSGLGDSAPLPAVEVIVPPASPSAPPVVVDVVVDAPATPVVLVEPAPRPPADEPMPSVEVGAPAAFGSMEVGAPPASGPAKSGRKSPPRKAKKPDVDGAAETKKPESEASTEMKKPEPEVAPPAPKAETAAAPEFRLPASALVAPAVVEEDADTRSPVPSPLLADVVGELRAVMEECFGVREQLRSVRQGFQEVGGELEEIRKGSRSARQQLQETEGALGELRRTLEQFAPLRAETEKASKELEGLRGQAEALRHGTKETGAELEQARKRTTELGHELPRAAEELKHVRGRTAEVQKELQAAEAPLAELRKTVLTIGEDQKTEARAIWDRFHNLHKDADEAGRQFGEFRGTLGTLRTGLVEAEGEIRAARESLRREVETSRSALQAEVKSLREELAELKGEVEVVRGRVGATGLETQMVRQLEAQKLEAAFAAPTAAVAVPVLVTQAVSEAPAEVARQDRKYLGVTVDADARVIAVGAGSPAEKAGLLCDDLVVSVDNLMIATSDGLREAIDHAAPGQEVRLTVRRGTEDHVFRVQLSEAPPA